MATIGIYAPNAAGHRLKYVQYLITHIHSESNEIILLTTSDAIQSRNFEVHLSSLRHCFREYIVDSLDAAKIPLYAHALNTDLMVNPDGDSMVWKELWRRGWKGPGKLSVLVMRPTGQSKRNTFRIIATLAKKALMVLTNMHRDTNVFELKSSLWDHRTDLRGVPDPITFDPDQVSLRAVLAPDVLDPARQWIGVVGALTPRKNIELILNSIARVEHREIGVLLAGQVDPPIKPKLDAGVTQLRKKQIPVIMLDELLTDGQFDAAINSLHCVVLAHSNEGPSGIMGKAVEAGTYVVAAGAQSLRVDCGRIQNARWSSLNEAQIAKSIEIGLQTSRGTPKRLHTDTVFACRLLLGTSNKVDSC